MGNLKLTKQEARLARKLITRLRDARYEGHGAALDRQDVKAVPYKFDGTRWTFEGELHMAWLDGWSNTMSHQATMDIIARLQKEDDPNE